MYLRGDTVMQQAAICDSLAAVIRKEEVAING